MPMTLPDTYVEHGSVEQLRRGYGLDVEGIADKIQSRWTKGRVE